MIGRVEDRDEKLNPMLRFHIFESESDVTSPFLVCDKYVTSSLINLMNIFIKNVTSIVILIITIRI